ncbi:MAG: aminomethyl-transferring glycine dehydrogenase [Chitinophagales bacterium]
MKNYKSDQFLNRHIGNQKPQQDQMLKTIGVSSLDELLNETIPDNILSKNELNIDEALSEHEYLKHIKSIAQKNKVFKNYIGTGYYNSITPAVIRRNIFENPGWYTQYTPYQAEIAQGRLEALLNFQTLVCDLTGMPIANASLLDEATAAAEAMNMFFNQKNKRKVTAPKFFVDEKTFPQTIDVLKTRSSILEIELVFGDYKNAQIDETFFGALVQYPNAEGSVEDYTSFSNTLKENNAYLVVAADILALVALKAPSEFGADCVVGTTQRFGIPMGFGGPHAAFFATQENYKRVIPGRIIGVSIDSNGDRALRMALQTREQHIRREKATSNICTAQALLAIMAGMYAVYHGVEGLTNIANNVHSNTIKLANNLKEIGFEIAHENFFDTITVLNADTAKLKVKAEAKELNLRYLDDKISISIDETTTSMDIVNLIDAFAESKGVSFKLTDENHFSLAEKAKRNTPFLENEVFSKYHTETEMMRYIKRLENKDISLVHSMIPLGSCTMKLNAAVQMEPVSWPEFANIHPFAPENQWQGYKEMLTELENDLSEITGFAATSLQPNSGAQGEFAGLMVIQAYHRNNGDHNRNIVLIPSSAHGTNPASAVMAGGKVVVVKCDEAGNIDVDDLREKAEKYKDTLASLMITYPSTHGVFESKVIEVTTIIHENGGQVYMDGANMNAQVGFTSPGAIGADVCHLNLHKTFAIPHGGGGPGVGPICVAKHLAPFLPGNPITKTGGEKAISAISAAPFGSASVCLVSYAYIKLLGKNGLKTSTANAILGANYIKARLEKHYKVLYTGEKFGRVAHELILDFRPYKHSLGIEVTDVAKRLMDFNFHAPTVSFPVAGTLMIEPTESENITELDRFCDAMIAIKEEINAIASGDIDKDDNPLKNAPHTIKEVCGNEWKHDYTREMAAFPLPYLKQNKLWATVARVNDSHGDRHLICTCAPIEDYMEE